MPNGASKQLRADLLPRHESEDSEPSEASSDCASGTSNDESDGHTKWEPEVASGSNGKSSNSEDEVFAKLKRPPCRQAGRYLARCPNCRVAMQVAHLKYRHVCNRSVDPKF